MVKKAKYEYCYQFSGSQMASKSVPEAKSASIFVLQSRDRAPNKAILLLWTGKSLLLIGDSTHIWPF